MSCSSYGKDKPEAKKTEAIINKADFYTQIVKGCTNTATHEYLGTSVLVVSPVLLKSSQAKWKGIFNGNEIKFTIVDKEFLKQVYAKEVRFTTGTSLTCDLKIITKTVYDALGKHVKSNKESEVSNITSWDDGNHILHETKRYKRKKIEEAMPLLFKDSDFE